jgi:hypothetical protein
MMQQNTCLQPDDKFGKVKARYFIGLTQRSSHPSPEYRIG